MSLLPQGVGGEPKRLAATAPEHRRAGAKFVSVGNTTILRRGFTWLAQAKSLLSGSC
jgi:hypothetical protein